MRYATQQKALLRELIEQAAGPMTAGDLCTEAQKQQPTLGIATVYRALKQFLLEGQVRAVEVPGATPHYESARRQHHHFFLCEQCRRLFNLLGCVPGFASLAPSGFQVERHEIVLYGRCAECLKLPSAPDAISAHHGCAH